MQEERQELDKKFLDAYEDLARAFWQVKEMLSDVSQESPQFNRLSLIEKKLTTERRIIEEISLPCRFILEHFSTFMGKFDHTLGYRVGQFQAGRALLSDFRVEKWGKIVLNMGNVQLTWRDEDYRYLFYPNKVVLRARDRIKPEMHLSFSFTFKHSHLLEMFKDVKNHPQVEYWHDDLV